MPFVINSLSPRFERRNRQSRTTCKVADHRGFLLEIDTILRDMRHRPLPYLTIATLMYRIEYFVINQVTRTAYPIQYGGREEELKISCSLQKTPPRLSPPPAPPPAAAP